MLNLFYKEPDPDRWFPGDRHPRALLRRIVRGPRRPGGQERVYLNLKEGLDRLKIPYRDNQFSWTKKNPNAPVGIVGKPHLLDEITWENPIMFGASIMSHPLADPTLLDRHPIQRILVPGEWMREMCEPHWGDIVKPWPIGIDVELWSPVPEDKKTTDVLLYNKIRWEHEHYDEVLLNPIRESLRKRGLSFTELKYGSYKEENFHQALKDCRTMIFICEHETQGIAYQQALACNIPLLVWERGGPWKDPEYYPDRVNYGPVSAVPYWDERCGEKFTDYREFEAAFDLLQENQKTEKYSPRDYIIENLTLEKCAQGYIDHYQETFGES